MLCRGCGSEFHFLKNCPQKGGKGGGFAPSAGGAPPFSGWVDQQGYNLSGFTTTTSNTEQASSSTGQPIYQPTPPVGKGKGQTPPWVDDDLTFVQPSVAGYAYNYMATLEQDPFHLPGQDPWEGAKGKGKGYGPNRRPRSPRAGPT